MSCGCNQDPCGCAGRPEPGCASLDDNAPVNENPYGASVATGDKVNNIWWRPGPPGYPGSSPLDLMTYGQVAYVLRKNPRAKGDLLRITTDPCLIRLANSIDLTIPDDVDNGIAAKRLQANSLPFYTVFKGNPYGNIT